MKAIECKMHFRIAFYIVFHDISNKDIHPTTPRALSDCDVCLANLLRYDENNHIQKTVRDTPHVVDITYRRYENK